MTEFNDAVTSAEANLKLVALLQVTDDFYYSEFEIPVDILRVSFKAFRSYLAGVNPTEEIGIWKKLLINEIEGSRFVSEFEINKHLGSLSSV